MGLNFGGTAFDGSNRWVQLEFRSPAGSGQYLTLNPRDKIMATPYAMFALNGGNGIWNYNAKAQTVSVLGQKVGIGTSTPTAALEVVGTGGDDAVKLPAGSIGADEVSFGMAAAGGEGTVGSPLAINCPSAGYIVVIGSGSTFCTGGRLMIDGADGGSIPMGSQSCGNSYTTWSIHRRVQVVSGAHEIELAWRPTCGGCLTGSFTVLFVPSAI